MTRNPAETGPTTLRSRSLQAIRRALPEAGLLRLCAVVVGGLLALESSSDLGLPKLIYLCLAGTTFIFSSLAIRNLRGSEMFDAARPWLAISLVLFSLIAISLPVSLAEGTPVSAWLRDAATYGLFAAAPVFALDAAASMQRRQLLALTVAAGALGALSYAANWISIRNLAILPFGPLVLPTTSLPTTLFLVAVASAILNRRHRVAWITVGGLVFGTFLVAATRSLLLTLVALPVVVGLAGRPFLKRSITASLGVCVVALALMVGVQATFRSTNPEPIHPVDASGPPGSAVESPVGSAVATAAGPPVATPARSSVATTAGSPSGASPGISRPTANPDITLFQRLQAFLAAPDRDGSFRERFSQYQAAWDVFLSRPVLGAGLGHVFIWTRVGGSVERAFTADTPLVLPAKLGILGILWVAMLIAVWVGFIRRLRRAGPSIPWLAMAGWAALLLVLAWTGFAVEDKGFSFSLMLLLALGLVEIEASLDQGSPILSRKPSIR